VSAAELLRNAAFCFADYAGRRDGSWEADAGRNLLMSAGYQEMIKWDKRERLSAWEEKRNAAWRKAHPIKPVI